MSQASVPQRNTQRASVEQLIEDRIEEARRALWWGELVRTLLTIAMGAMSAVLLWLVIDHWLYSPGPLVRSVALLAFLSVASWAIVRKAWPVLTSRVTREYAAWAIEKDHPDYRQQLTSYVTLRPAGVLRGIRARIVGVLGTRAATLLKTHDQLPTEATGTFRWWIATAVVFALLTAYIVGSPKSSVASATRLIAPLSDIDPAKRVQITEVQPGDSDALAGRRVKISARVTGLGSDEPVWCRWSVEETNLETELEYNFEYDLFQGEFNLPHSASGVVPYTIEAGDDVAGPFSLTVENVPVVAVESVFQDPPGYTGRKPKTLSSPAINVIDGTTVRLTAKANHAIKRAEIQFNPKKAGSEFLAMAGRKPMEIAEDGVTLTAELKLRSARGKTAAVERESYRIRVWDNKEQSNPAPIIYPIRIIPDLPPEVAIVVPHKSPIQVPFNAQQIIEVHAMDADFELQEVSLRIDRGIDTLSEPVIWLKGDKKSGRGNQVSEYRFRPSEHRLNVGDTVRITAIALDNRELPGDRSVEPNRSTTDPVEIRIIDDETDLPEDPAGNDGLSRPDQRPPSDAEASDTEQGASGGSSSDGDAASQQQTSESESGESSGQPQSGEPSGDSDPSSGASESEDAGKGDTEPQNSSDGTGQPSGSPEQGEGDPSADPQTSGGQDDGQSEDRPEQMSDLSENHDDGESSGQPGERSNGESGPESSEAPGESSDGGTSDDSNPPPKHDGEAFERIKDYVEKKRREQSGSDSRSDQSQQGNEAKDPSREQGEPDQESGSDMQEESADGDQQNSGEQNGESPSNESQSPEGRESGSPKEDTAESESPRAPDSQSDDGAGDTPQQQQGDPGDVGAEEKSTQEAGDSQSPEQGEPKSSGDDANPDGQQKPQGDGEPKDPRESGGKGQTESGNSSDGQSDAESPSGADPKQGGDTPGDETQSSGDQPDEMGDSSEGQGDSSAAPESDQPSDPRQSAPNSEPQDSSSSSSGDGTGTGSMPNPGQDDSTPPEPDLEYAKKATDMVLDYLDETREHVDKDLLEDLNWTEDDLRRFRDRWQNVRELEQAPSGQPKNELEDALRSLGLQSKGSSPNTKRQNADTFRNLRDSGNRRKPPPAFRDAFEAFRRGK